MHTITLTDLDHLDPDQAAAVRDYASRALGSIEPVEPGAAPQLRWTPATEGTPDVLEFHAGTEAATWTTVAMGAGEPPALAHGWTAG